MRSPGDRVEHLVSHDHPRMRPPASVLVLAAAQDQRGMLARLLQHRRQDHRLCQARCPEQPPGPLNRP
jgi:hypothetical protein